MFAYILINCKFRAFNYARVWFWHMLSLCGVLWLGLMTTLDMLTVEHLSYIGLLFAGWFVMIVFGVLVQNKLFPSRIKLEKHPDLPRLFAWAFRPKGYVRAHTEMFRSQNIYGKGEADRDRKHHCVSKIGRMTYASVASSVVDGTLDPSNYSHVDQISNYSSVEQYSNINHDPNLILTYDYAGMIIPEREMSDEDN